MMQIQSPTSILVVKLSAIGDVVHTLPFLEATKARFPQSRIDWLVEESAFQIVEGHRAINRVFMSRRKSWQKRLVGGGNRLEVFRELSHFLKEIRADEYDLVVDLQGLFKSGVLTGLAKAKRKIGMSGGREGASLFLNERPLPVDYHQHAIDRYLKVAAYMGCDISQWEGVIPVLESDKKSVNRLWAAQGLGKMPVVALNPMAKWNTKLWEPERFAALADRLRDHLRCDVVFTGGREDFSMIEDISRLMKNRTMNLAGKTSLKELAYLYTKCDLVVTTDTGPMHVAAAMGCPVVAIFGPTAPWRTGPYGNGHKVIQSDVACTPCFKKHCTHMSCMKEITVEKVFKAARDVLEREGGQSCP